MKEDIVKIEDEIYCNATININLETTIRYIHCDKKSFPNYVDNLENMIEITDKNKDLYNININLKKEKVYVKTRSYELRFNDFHYNETFKTIAIEKNDIESITFKLENRFGRICYIKITEYGVKMFYKDQEEQVDNIDYIYKIPYDISYEKFKEIKNDAKMLSSQIFLQFVKNVSDDNTTTLEAADKYKEQYENTLLLFLQFYAINKQEIDENFSKVLKR